IRRARRTPRLKAGGQISWRLVAFLGDKLDVRKALTVSKSVIQLDIQSSFEMVDLVQAVFESIAEQVGFDPDSSHWMSVAIRESVTNAVRHGNKMDASKRVIVRFEYAWPDFMVYVEDEGQGFDLADIPNPLADENLLRANGRGIFFMKSFMDEVVYRFPPNRGTQVKMVKKVSSGAR
ncbi:MAG: ATP-binding protein, partial [Acidobacteriota bacterium]